MKAKILIFLLFFFFKQKTAYEIKECDWSSDVCSSDLKLQKRFKPSFLFIHRRDLCILTLGIACGLRRGEIHMIKIQDVDFNSKTILIHGKGNQRFIVKERMAFFSHPFLVELIDRYYELRKTLPGDNFFCNCDGKELNPSTINVVYKKYRSFYSEDTLCNPTITRKSFASQLVYKKVNTEAIRVVLGHKRAETTLRYYVHFSALKLEKTWKETNPYANTDSL